MIKEFVSLFWFRRDLRLEDNVAFANALQTASVPVLPIFIFDSEILERLENKSDARVQFIHQTLQKMDEELRTKGSGLWVGHGSVIDVFTELFEKYDVRRVYCNGDYEPSAVARDIAVEKLCEKRGITFHSFKDQVIFEKREIAKDDGNPYTVYTPYSKKWLAKLKPDMLKSHVCHKYFERLKAWPGQPLPTLKKLGFKKVDCEYPPCELDPKRISAYAKTRDLPALEHGTSHIGLHLRFGTISIRNCVALAKAKDLTWLKELIWREFFMQILWNFPHVVEGPFRPEYSKVKFRHDEKQFAKWCAGQTGFPLVDAGMRELNETGFMHNRVRMVAASFLVKDLLIDWRWGESYFASKLLDFDLASNNGNWQWVAGTGCDAVPYFRVFNPEIQQQKFDPEFVYIRRWIPEFGKPKYPEPMVDRKESQARVMNAYAAAKR